MNEPTWRRWDEAPPVAAPGLYILCRWESKTGGFKRPFTISVIAKPSAGKNDADLWWMPVTAPPDPRIAKERVAFDAAWPKMVYPYLVMNVAWAVWQVARGFPAPTEQSVRDAMGIASEPLAQDWSSYMDQAMAARSLDTAQALALIGAPPPAPPPMTGPVNGALLGGD